MVWEQGFLDIAKGQIGKALTLDTLAQRKLEGSVGQ